MARRRSPFPSEDHWFPIFWIFYLVIPLLFLGGEIGPQQWVIEAVGLVVFLPMYVAGHWARTRRAYVATIGATMALAVALSLLVGGVNTTILVYSAYFAGRQPRLSSAIVGLLTIVATFAVLVLSGAVRLGDAVIPFLFALTVGAAQRGVRRLTEHNIQLREARDEVERLAQLLERERIARDLHDLLGQTLSLIVLKSQLAARLAPADASGSVTVVARELADIERVGRQALAQVRAVVRGYRTEGLAAECASARAILAEAGIECGMMAIPPASSCAPSVEGALSLILKEAVTNVVRHSAAKSCTIRFDLEPAALRLVVEDDGRGNGGEPEGSGIKGMRERVAALGGSLVRAARAGGGTSLTIDVPQRALSAGAAANSAASEAPTAGGAR